MTRPGHHEWNKNFWSFFVRCLVESVTHGWSIVTTRIKASGGHCARQGCSIHLVSTARLSDLGSRRMLKENSLRDYYTKGKGMRLFVSLRCEIKIFGLYVMQPVWFSCCRGRTPPPPSLSPSSIAALTQVIPSQFSQKLQFPSCGFPQMRSRCYQVRAINFNGTWYWNSKKLFSGFL